MEQISFVYMTTTNTFQQRKKKKTINSRCWKNNLAENIFQTKKKYIYIIYDNPKVSKCASRHFLRRSRF